ncbi:MAG: tetratricopeptide repeat protein, partial [Marinicella sp.]
LGLMSLAVQMIQADNSIDTISNGASSRVSEFEINDGFKVADAQVSSLKDQLKATHLVFSMLENADDDQFKLSYSVYHPKGKQDVIELIGDNPTNLTQKMVNQITNKLPNSSIATPKFKAISDNIFTNELYARGVSHRLEGDAKAAREYFSLVIKEEPDLFWPRYQYALTSNKLGKYDEAIASLEKLLIDIPKILNDKDLEAGVNNAMGISYMQKSDHEKGIEYYSNAYEIAKESGNRDYQEKIASNIAWIYKDKKDFDKSRAWLAKSIESRNGLDLPPNINNIYLKGQLEFYMNNFDKAETIFAEAYQLYEGANLNRQAAKVLNIRARVQNLKGNWEKAHRIVDQSFQLSEKVDDDLGRLDSQSMRSQVLINEGKYTEALAMIQEAIVQSESLQQDRKTRGWKNQEINTLFKQMNYDLALEKINLMPARDKPLRKGQVDTLQLKRHQIAYLKGDKTQLLEWIENYKNESDNLDLQAQYRLSELKLFMLEHDQDDIDKEVSDQLIKAYREEINIERQLGYEANIAQNLIKIAHLHINQNEFAAFEEVLDELHLFELDWWQIDLLESFKLYHQNKPQLAKELAEKAKQHSTETWGKEERNLYAKII